MAYIDDNNDNLSRRGDPLEELDSELAQLKATLGRLEADKDSEKVSEKPNSAPDEPVRDSAPRKTDTPEPVITEAPYREDGVRAPCLSPAQPPEGKKPPKALPIILVIAALVIIGAAGAVVFSTINKPAESDVTPTASGEKVTINDSVMGDIELKTVKGAEIDTKTADNLKTDENGYPAYYEDGVKISHLGIDLSEFQGEIDFTKAKAAGVEFVMLRLGGRYYGEDGGMYEDKAFESYYEQAKAAGLKVGAYFFSQAISAEDAEEEAAFALQKLSGKKLDYPVAFDWENISGDDARTDSTTGSELTVIAEAFCDRIIAAGYKAVVYANTQQMFIMYDFETMKDYKFWLADYRDFPTMYYRYDMWQYSTDGQVDGIEGNVDMNLSFTEFE